MKYKLDGRVILITGATGGLGRALCAELRKRNAKLALLDLDADALGAQAQQLGGDGVAKGWVADVRDLQMLEAVTAEVVAHFGCLDVVIAAAGIGSVFGPLDLTSDEDWTRTIDINLNGVWRTLKAAAPYIQQQKGQLVAIASMASFLHSPLHGSYTASKAGVWALCNSLRLECRHQGVSVTSVHPTFFKTPMVDEAFERSQALRIWNDFKGAFALTSIDSVVKDIVRGIERRTEHVVSPRLQTMVGLVPGMARRVVEGFAFSDANIRDAIELCEEEARRQA